MNEVAGVADIYKKDKLVEQMRSEVIGTFQNVVNELGNSEHKVPVLEIPSQTDEIKELMDKYVFDEPIRKRGIALVGFIVESVTLDDESNKKIDQYELSSNAYMQQGTLTGAYANAVQEAAKNSNGAMNGFMGIGMMNMASNGVIGGATTGPWQNTQKSTINSRETSKEVKDDDLNKVVEQDEWICECGIKNKGKFCINCGKKHEIKIKCPKCGTINEAAAKFCNECGEKLQ